jgi:hypothetical protein
MTAPSTELSVELIEDVLKEKEAALAKEQALLEDLKRVLGRMGYELIPAQAGKPRQSKPATPGVRGRGRPRKDGTAALPSSEGAAGG